MGRWPVRQFPHLIRAHRTQAEFFLGQPFQSVWMRKRTDFRPQQGNIRLSFFDLAFELLRPKTDLTRIVFDKVKAYRAEYSDAQR